MPETAVATAAKPHPIIVLRDYMQERKDSFRQALPPHINPDRFIASAMTAAQLNPDLVACEKRSFFTACMRCAQDGLLPDGVEAAIVAYKDKAQYLPMYQGLLKKFRNSGQFRWIAANLVYEGDEFEHWIDQDGEHFRHVPGDAAGRQIKRVYAVATTKDGGSFIADLSLADINKRRSMSRASRDDAPWKQWPDEMMKKTAIRVLSKLLPKSSDLDSFMQRDEQESLGVDTTPSSAITDAVPAAYGSALDYFASETAADTASQANVGGEGSPQETVADASGEASAPAPLPAAADDNNADPAIRKAYEAGRAWRAGKGKRSAMPPEYRDSKRLKEAIAWQDGYDNKPMPKFDT